MTIFDEQIDFSAHFDLLEEQVSSMLVVGTKFEKDVKLIVNQSTFKQCLDRSGISNTIIQPIYDMLPRLKQVADALPDKTLLWKSLYLGAVYKALLDHQALDKVLG